MPRLRVVRTATFRLSALYVGLFTFSVLILGAVVYFAVGYEIEREFDERILAELQSLASGAGKRGAAALSEDIRARIGHAATFDYRLESADGQLISGNLPMSSVIGRSDGLGWAPLSQHESGPDEDDDADWERIAVATLNDGSRLVVGRELSEVAQARRSVLVAFSGAAMLTLVLGTVGGLVLSALFLRRVDSMTRAAEGIIAGDLRQRIPEARVDDDIARLARTFNRMFDRSESLIDANRHVSQNIAHDLRRPLARILRRLEAVRAGEANLSEYEEAVDAAICDVEGVVETFNALLRIAQIEAGARRSRFEFLDLSVIASEVAEAFAPAAAEEGRELSISTETEFPLSGDRELLCQLIANVIDNALRHTPAGVAIRVRSDRIDGRSRLSIEDSGPGVPEPERTRIFERFYRVDASRAPPGDGLGLSLVAAIADLHGLQFSAQDNRPGLRIVLQAPGRAEASAAWSAN